MTKSGDTGEDFVGRFGPHKRPGPLVGDRDVPPDRGLELLRTAMHAAAQLFLGEGGKPPFDEVDPGRPGRREVHVVARMAREPAPNAGRLVRPIVVEDQMDVEGRRHGRLDGVEELAEFHGPVPLVNSPMTLPVATFRAAKSEVVPCRV